MTSPQAPSPSHRPGPVGRWLAGRRVGTRLLMAIAVVALAAVSVGLVSLQVMNSLQAQRQQELGHAVPYITGLQAAALAAKAAATDERGFLVTGDAKYAQESLGREESVDAALQQARASAADDAERAAVDAAQQQVDAWFTALAAEYELAATDRDAAVAVSFGANRDLRKAYEASLGEETQRAGDALAAGEGFAATVRNAQLGVLALLVGSVLLGAGVAVVIGRSIVGPLRHVTAVLGRVADGDLAATADIHSRDEIGVMAQALDRSTGRFRAVVEQIAGSAGELSGSAQQLSAVSSRLSEGAEESSGQAQRVAGATEEISTNIATVAAAGEEMTAAIHEIAASTSEASATAADAVARARAAADTLERLSASSREIGDVVKLITAIAEQTNLLALNATIEAARAGETGKGFAVVAGEVKELAQQTARATESIITRVSATQADAAAAADAIQAIGGIISRIDDLQSTVSAAVEEQSATTAEMVRNVTEVSGGSRQIAADVGGIADAAARTTQSATGTAQTATDLERSAARLRELVGTFRY